MFEDSLNSYADRYHRGHRTVAICYMRDRKVYRVTVWPRIDTDPFRVGHVHLEYSTYEEACAVGDALAHPDCDGNCEPWPIDPRLKQGEMKSGKRCPSCGVNMWLVDERPVRRMSSTWTCKNPDCASFEVARTPRD